MSGGHKEQTKAPHACVYHQACVSVNVFCVTDLTEDQIKRKVQQLQREKRAAQEAAAAQVCMLFTDMSYSTVQYYMHALYSMGHLRY